MLAHEKSRRHGTLTVIRKKQFFKGLTRADHSTLMSVPNNYVADPGKTLSDECTSIKNPIELFDVV